MTEKEFLSDFSERLRRLMKEKKVTQTELAEKTWLSRSTIHRCLQGDKVPTLDTYVNLVVALDVEPRELANVYWRIKRHG
jgi:transcriptional regulator with XRE-family HTH domain